MVVATYSITDARREKVGFAGPYMLTQQGIMIRAADRAKYQKLDDLSGKTVCSTTGSTSIEQLSSQLGFSVTKREETVPVTCMNDLLANQVDAVSTDQLLLYGLAKNNSQLYVPPDMLFGQQQRYGAGLPRGDTAKCQAVTEKLKHFINDGLWDRYFDDNLGDVPKQGHKPDANRLDPC
jgi:glutamate transport system substrate-binding protein